MRTFISTLCVVLGCSLSSAQNAPGIHPRGAPSDYATSQRTATATYAVSVVPADQVKHLFAGDVGKSYVVFEVACYPSDSASVTVDPDDFLIKTGSNSEFIHPAEAATVALVIQEKNMPKPSNRGTDVYTSVGVGYESGTDPYTGRRVHGTYTEAGVGVANGPNPPPPYVPPPADRVEMEQQLAKKALPAGNFTMPVAGFLYFPADSLKKAKGKYELQYLSDPAGKVRLQISGLK